MDGNKRIVHYSNSVINNPFNCQVLFAALLAFASAKPKPLVVEYDYPVHYDVPVVAAYTAPVAYSYSYDYFPYSSYTYADHYDHYDHYVR